MCAGLLLTFTKQVRLRMRSKLWLKKRDISCRTLPRELKDDLHGWVYKRPNRQDRVYARLSAVASEKVQKNPARSPPFFCDEVVGDIMLWCLFRPYLWERNEDQVRADCKAVELYFVCRYRFGLPTGLCGGTCCERQYAVRIQAAPF